MVAEGQVYLTKVVRAPSSSDERSLLSSNRCGLARGDLLAALTVWAGHAAWKKTDTTPVLCSPDGSGADLTQVVEEPPEEQPSGSEEECPRIRPSLSVESGFCEQQDGEVSTSGKFICS
jgi:hypothetical protein